MDSQTPRRNMEKERVTDIWTAKGLRVVPGKIFTCDVCYEESDILQKLENKYRAQYDGIKHKFLAGMSDVITKGKSKMGIVNKILSTELSDIKLELNNLVERDGVIDLKLRWFSTIDTWASDISQLERDMVVEVKEPIRRYVRELMLSRKNMANIPDALLSIILEVNQLQLGNVQTMMDTCWHLKSLWEKYYKLWKAGTIYESLGRMDEEVIVEEDIEIDYNEIFTENMVEMQSELVQMKEKHGSEVEEIIIKYLPFHPILLCIENNCKDLKSLEYLMIDCLDSEFMNILLEKRRLLEALYRANNSNCPGKKEDLEDRFCVFTQYQNSFSSAISSLKIFLDWSNKALETMRQSWNNMVEMRLGSTEKLYLKNMMKIRREEDALYQAEMMSLNITIDLLRSAPTLVSLDEIWKNSVLHCFNNLKQIHTKAYTKKNEVLTNLEEYHKKCFEAFIACVDLVKSSMVQSDLENIPTPDTAEEGSFIVTFTLAFQNAFKLFNGLMDTYTFLRDCLELSLSGLDGGDQNKAEREEHCYVLDLKEKSLDFQLQQTRPVYELRAKEIHEHRNKLMAHVHGINADLAEMKLLNKKVEKDGKGLDIEYEGVYKALSKVKDTIGSLMEARALKVIHDVKTKHDYVMKRKEHMGKRSEDLLERRLDWLDCANTYFLHQIKMFHEGGEYNSEEVSKAMFTVNRCSNDIKEVGRLCRTKLKKLLKSKLSSYTKKASLILGEIKDRCEEDGLARLIEGRVENTKREVKREIGLARIKIAQLQRLLERRREGRSLSGWEDTVDEINVTIGFFIYNKPRSKLKVSPSRMTLGSMVRPSTKSLVRGTAMSLTPHLLSSRSRSSQRLGRTRSSHRYRKSTRSSRKQNLSIYSVKKRRSVSSRTFWEMIRNILRNGLIGLCYIFKKHPQTPKAAYEEALTTIQSMKPKLEIVWMDMIIDLLVLLFIFKIDLRQLLVSKLDVYKEVCITRMRNMEKAYLLDRDALESRTYQGLAGYNERLKTMYGAPGLSWKLIEMNEDALDFSEDVLTQYRQMIETLRVEMRAYLTGLNMVRMQFEEEMSYLLLNVHDNQLTDNFLRNIKYIMQNVSGMLKEPLLSQISIKSYKSTQAIKKPTDSSDEDSLDLFCERHNLNDLVTVAEQLAKEILDPGDTWNPNKENYLSTSLAANRATVCNILSTPTLTDFEIANEDLRAYIIQNFQNLVESSIKQYMNLGQNMQEWINQWEYSYKEIEKLYEF